MTAQKPASVPYWTQGLTGQVAAPPVSLRNTGFTAGQPPAAEIFNNCLYELGQYIAYLDQVAGSTALVGTLDTSVRLLGGGTLGYIASSTTLTWSQPFNLSIPSIPDTDNTLPAGSAVIPSGSVAYVSANVPFTTSGDITAGSTQAINLAYELPITPGQTVTGQGITPGTTVAVVSGNTVTLSQAATTTATQEALTFSGSGTLGIQVAPISQLNPASNTIILARGTGSHVLVGVNAAVTALHDGEQKTLLEPGYLGVIRVPAGQALIAGQAVYISQDQSGTRTQGAAYPTDVSAINGATRASCAGFVITSVTQGQTATIMVGGLLPLFSSLVTGAQYWLDPANLGGITATQPALSTTPYVVRVGQALSQTTLFARPEHQPDGVFPSVQANTASIATLNATNATFSGTASGGFSSSTGFKSVVGPFFISNASLNASSGAATALADGAGAPGQAVFPFAGSVVGLSIHATASATAQGASAAVQILLYKNGTQIQAGPSGNTYVNSVLTPIGSAPYSKGLLPFTPADSLQIYARAAGTAVASANVRAYITVEMGA